MEGTVTFHLSFYPKFKIALIHALFIQLKLTQQFECRLRFFLKIIRRT